jgi:hypothetical protein
MPVKVISPAWYLELGVLLYFFINDDLIDVC